MSPMIYSQRQIKLYHIAEDKIGAVNWYIVFVLQYLTNHSTKPSVVGTQKELSH